MISSAPAADFPRDLCAKALDLSQLKKISGKNKNRQLLTGGS
jgi:hypothetical protein